MSVDPRSALIVAPLPRAAARRRTLADGRGRWFIEQRLRFIESRLFWAGTINRRDLVEHFGINQALASQDLSEYQRLAPRNAVYDKSAKLYRAGRQFRPAFPNPSLSALVAHTQLRDGFAPLASAADVPPTLDRVADPVVARNIAAACREGFALRVFYRSMSHPDGGWRWLEPRHLVTDGWRWHVRAWCREREGFRDFVLSRIEQADEPAAAQCTEQIDEDWESVVNVIIQPHPGLTPQQRTMTERDYAMTDGRLLVPCRKALMWYLLRNLGLDIDDRPPRQVLALADTSLRNLAGIPATATRQN